MWFWQDGRCTKVWRLSNFLRRGCPFPPALLAFAPKLCRVAISGRLSQLSKAPMPTTGKEPEAHVLHENCDLLCIRLRCGRISVFYIAIKLFKKFWVICRSTNCVCCFIQLVITLTSVPINVFLTAFIVIIFMLIDVLIRVISGNCIFDARRGLGEVKIVNCCHHCFRFLGFCISCCQRSITPLCTEGFCKMRECPHCCQCFHPQRLLCHSRPAQMQTHSKSNLKFQPA